MAHIAEFLSTQSSGLRQSSIGLNNYIARELSPPLNNATARCESPQVEEKHVWRMQQPTERRYNIFPSHKLSIRTGRKNSETDTICTTSTAPPADRILKKSRSKDGLLPRRRKVSVPELGPMTTVQEVAMDSPTIPGRPPVHERSASVPGHSWKNNLFGEVFSSSVTVLPIDEQAEERQETRPSTRSRSPKQPASPKTLAPLQIPDTVGSPPKLMSLQDSIKATLSPELDRPDVPPKTRIDERPSPLVRTPYTPMSSTTTLSMSTNTPISAPDDRISPNPWTMMPNQSPVCHARGQSDTSIGNAVRANHHRRELSETSIIDRGRPKKRTDGRSIGAPRVKRNISAEKQAAFDALPKGIKPSDAPAHLEDADIEALRLQALGQASRFEVLRSADVEALSKELRTLDERCEYLRKTHHSLRAGRRNLHERICSYLRSPRVARFSHDSMLKQEEALAELDVSIDDWVAKLEQAENRRTRVRQKLLEHVAAAILLETSAMRKKSASGERTPPRSPTKSTSPAQSPSRSPARSPPRERTVSPQIRLDDEDCVLPPPIKPVAALSAPIGPPPPKPMPPPPAAAMVQGSPTIPPADYVADRYSVMTTRTRRDVESILIYADSDVFALLADVEEQMKQMSNDPEPELDHKPAPGPSPLSPGSQLLPATSFRMAQAAM